MNLKRVLAVLLPTAAVLSPAVSILFRDHITSTECLCTAVGRSGARMVPTSPRFCTAVARSIVRDVSDPKGACF